MCVRCFPTHSAYLVGTFFGIKYFVVKLLKEITSERIFTIMIICYFFWTKINYLYLNCLGFILKKIFG